MGKPVILILDDDPSLRKTLTDILKIEGLLALLDIGLNQRYRYGLRHPRGDPRQESLSPFSPPGTSAHRPGTGHRPRFHADKHSGTVTFESEPGGGTTFSIRLPRSKL